eukprot:109666_1
MDPNPVPPSDFDVGQPCPAFGFAVDVITDCPHVDRRIVPLIESKVELTVTDPCYDCKHTDENWICLTCYITGCSRYVNCHMLVHSDKTRRDDPENIGHCIAVSFKDFSCWCFRCDSYIASSRTDEYISELKISKSLLQSQQDDEKQSERKISPDEPTEALQSGLASLQIDDSKQPELPSVDPSLAEISKGLRDGKYRKVVVLTGAGISTSCGIPDFRSPGTGLYDNLQKFNLPNPMAIFEIGFFKEHPEPFYALAKELYPGKFTPSIAHQFLVLLEKKGVLLRHFTQNIDCLDRKAGLSPDRIVEAHGSFAQCHCLQCRESVSLDIVKHAIFSDEVPRCPDCGGLVKPDIVFFGEVLPRRFAELVRSDLSQADLLIVMGSSLKVEPVASLIDLVPDSCPRMLINREASGVHRGLALEDLVSESQLENLTATQREELELKLRSLGQMGGGFRFDESDNCRDVFIQSDCDEGVRKLCGAVGSDWLSTLESDYVKTCERCKREDDSGQTKGVIR